MIICDILGNTASFIFEIVISNTSSVNDGVDPIRNCHVESNKGIGDAFQILFTCQNEDISAVRSKFIYHYVM